MLVLRPKQWIKNLLVFAAPLAAGQIFEASTFIFTCYAFVVFTILSSGIYVLNDVIDEPQDKKHKTKSKRAIASGEIKRKTAIVYSIAIILTGIFLTFRTTNYSFEKVVTIFLILQFTYIFLAKHFYLYDLIFISFGFVLRAMAGGILASIPISIWFITVTFCVSLFITTGKRYSEKISMLGNLVTRKNLDSYSIIFLKSLLLVSLTLSITFYTLWAVELYLINGDWKAPSSIIPVTIILLTYLKKIFQGEAEAPEDIILNNLSLLLPIGLWILLFISRIN